MPRGMEKLLQGTVEQIHQAAETKRSGKKYLKKGSFKGWEPKAQKKK